jgi:hypothetical protein
MIAYLVTGMLIGAVSLYFLPRPDLSKKRAENPEPTDKQTKPSEVIEQNSNIPETKEQTPLQPPKQETLEEKVRSGVLNNCPPDQRQKLQRMLDRYDNDEYLRIKFCLFKALVIIIMILGFVILVNGNLNFAEFFYKLEQELSFYKRLFQL